jgi:hypothetical protein
MDKKTRRVQKQLIRRDSKPKKTDPTVHARFASGDTPSRKEVRGPWTQAGAPSVGLPTEELLHKSLRTPSKPTPRRRRRR